MQESGGESFDSLEGLGRVAVVGLVLASLGIRFLVDVAPAWLELARTGLTGSHVRYLTCASQADFRAGSTRRRVLPCSLSLDSALAASLETGWRNSRCPCQGLVVQACVP
jgi:hypothetical protein